MSGFYFRFYNLLPAFLRRRINPLEDAVCRFVAGAAKLGPKAVIVDAGAGQSRFAELFRSQLYVALDFGRGDGGWDYSRLDVVGDLQHLPLKDDCAAAVINTQVLEHLPEPAEALREMHRILEPGGRLFLTAPQGWHEHQQPHDYYRFTSFALERLLSGAGFGSWTIDPIGGYFHYLGHRLTYIPKLLFWPRGKVVRILLFPVEVLFLILFCFAGPLLCYYLDRLDRDKEFTLCYRCLAIKGIRCSK
jgi:SAM-dependent methyltransferase